ncbi:MAG TPA: hypothetical protein VHC97_24650 [Thermoanaerobaculia bacterium]|nr:hypothetical protein [Thermoanaerobaculia bacterium]
MRLGDCLKLINRRIWDHQKNIAQRRAQGLQVAPLLHRIRELEILRREIAALATPKVEGDLPASDRDTSQPA